MKNRKKVIIEFDWYNKSLDIVNSSRNQNKYGYETKGQINQKLPENDEIDDEYIQGDSDDVEEIVYHVNDEGFLVDENGDFIVDEQGNFLKLSPDQLKEIEDNDIIYDEREEYD